MADEQQPLSPQDENVENLLEQAEAAKPLFKKKKKKRKLKRVGKRKSRYKFWPDVEPEGEPAVPEIVQKKSLLRYASDKLYVQMGLLGQIERMLMEVVRRTTALQERTDERVELRDLNKLVHDLRVVGAETTRLKRLKVQQVVKMEDAFNHVRHDLRRAKKKEEDDKSQKRTINVRNELPVQTPTIRLDPRLLAQARKQAVAAEKAKREE